MSGADMRRYYRERVYRKRYSKLYSKPIAAAPKGATARVKKSFRRKTIHLATEDRRLRDSTLKQKIPSSPDIATLFAIANGNTAAPETERVQAVSDLLGEYRSQLEQFDNKEIEGIDPLLLQGIKDWVFRIFSKPNPVLALEKFLGVRQPRGKRAKNTDRDLQIAVDVVKEMREQTSEKTLRKRVSLEKAAEVVASKYELEAERIQKIYKRHRVAARAEVALFYGG